VGPGRERVCPFRFGKDRPRRGKPSEEDTPLPSELLPRPDSKRRSPRSFVPRFSEGLRHRHLPSRNRGHVITATGRDPVLTRASQRFPTGERPARLGSIRRLSPHRPGTSPASPPERRRSARVTSCVLQSTPRTSPRSHAFDGRAAGGEGKVRAVNLLRPAKHLTRPLPLARNRGSRA
jgi:hypothetical protein